MRTGPVAGSTPAASTTAPDPFDSASFGAALDHDAFYVNTFGPEQLALPSGPLDSDEDTGLRCWCGREVVSTVGDDQALAGTGWAHVGIGDRSDPT